MRTACFEQTHRQSRLTFELLNKHRIIINYIWTTETEYIWQTMNLLFNLCESLFVFSLFFLNLFIQKQWNTKVFELFEYSFVSLSFMKFQRTVHKYCQSIGIRVVLASYLYFVHNWEREREEVQLIIHKNEIGHRYYWATFSKHVSLWID